MVVLSNVDAKFFRQFFESKKAGLSALKEWGMSGRSMTLDELADAIRNRLTNLVQFEVDDVQVNEVNEVEDEVQVDAVQVVEEQVDEVTVEVNEVEGDVQVDDVQVDEEQFNEDLDEFPFSVPNHIQSIRCFHRDSLRYFLSDLNRDLGNIKYDINFTSMKGGTYYASGTNLVQLYNLAAGCHAFRSKYYLVEQPTEKFKFFLDIEDKSKSIEFDEHILDYINSRLEIIFRDNFRDFDERMMETRVCRNSKYWEYKVHVIFPNVIVKRETYSAIIALLKESLSDDVGNCVDDNAKSLRILGASKPSKEVNGEYVSSHQMGVYLPDEKVENNESKFEIYHYDESSHEVKLKYKDGITVEAFRRYSIRTRKPETVLKSGTFFVESLYADKDTPLDKRIKELSANPSTNEFLDEHFPTIVRMLKPNRSIKYFSWLVVGKAIFRVYGDSDCAIELFQEFSSKSPSHQLTYMQDSKNLIKKLEFNEDDDDVEDDSDDEDDNKKKRQNAVRQVMKMALKDNYKNLIDLIGFDVRDENKRLFEEYTDPIDPSLVHTRDQVSKYVSPDIYESNCKAILVKSAMGSGKTSALITYLSQHPELSFCWVVPRIAHGRGVFSSLCEKNIKVSLYSDIKGQILQSKIVVQYESLHKVQRTYDVVICDEIESIYHQAVSVETNSDNIDLNIAKFQNLLTSSKRVFLSDAYLSQRSLKLMRRLSIPYHLVEYTTLNVDRKCCLYDGVKEWKDELCKAIESNKKLFVFCGSLNFMETLYQSFDESIQSKVKKYSSRDGNIELTNINQQWQGYQVIMTTSTLTIGVDCQIPFDDIFCYHANQSSVLTRDVFQSLYRVRHITGMVHMCLDETYPNYEKRLPLYELGIVNHIKREMTNNKEIYQRFKIFDRYHNLSCETLLFSFLVSDLLEGQVNRQMFKELVEHYLKISGYTIHFTVPVETQCVPVEEKHVEFPLFADIPDLSSEEEKLMNSKKLPSSFDNTMKVMKHHFSHHFKIEDMDEGTLNLTFHKYVKNKEFRSKVSTYRKMKSTLFSDTFKYIGQGKSNHMALAHNKLRAYDVFRKVNTLFQKQDVLSQEALDTFFEEVKEDLIKLNISIPKKTNNSKKQSNPAKTSINEFLLKYTFEKLKQTSTRTQENKVRTRTSQYSIEKTDLRKFIRPS